MRALKLISWSQPEMAETWIKSSEPELTSLIESCNEESRLHRVISADGIRISRFK